MKKEKKVRTYQRRTKSGKTVTVRAHTASYEAAEKAKEAAKKKGAGDEIAERKKKNWELPMNEFLKKLKEERAQKREEEESKRVEDEKTKESEKKTEKKTPAKKTTKKRTVGTGTNGPEPKKKTTTKKTATKADTSEPAFTSAEFKEWYRGTGSDADKKVAKALRKQLGRSGYRKFEDEAISNYTSRGHLSMFKRVSGGSSTGSTKESNESKVSKVSSKVPKAKPEKKSVKGSLGITKSEFKEWYSDTDGSSPSFKKVNKALKKFYGKDWDEVENRAVFGGKTQYQDMLKEIGSRFATSPKISKATASAKTSKTTKVSSASSFMDGYKDMNALREYASQVMDEITPYKAKTRKELKRIFDADQGKGGSHEKAFKKFLKDEWLPNKDNVQGNRDFYLGNKSSKASSKVSKKRQVGTGTNGPEPKIRHDLPKITHGGDMKKDSSAYRRANETLKREGFSIGKDNLYHHKDGRTVRINSKTGYYEETPKPIVKRRK